MHPRAILAIARKDAIDILLNKSTVVVLIMPIAMSVLSMLISRLVDAHSTNMLVYHPGQSPLVQVVSKDFDQVHITEASSLAEVTAAFGPNGAHKDSAYDVGLIIPAGFESALRAGSRPQITLYLTGNNLSVQTKVL